MLSVVLAVVLGGGSATATGKVDLPTREQARRLVSDAAAAAPGVFTAPELPEWPSGLQGSVSTGAGAGVTVTYLVEDTGETGILGDGQWLDEALADAVWERLMAGDQITGQCQARLDALADEIVAAAIDVTDDMATTRADLRHAEEAAAAYSLGDVAIGAVVGIVVGLVAAGGVWLGVTAGR